MKRHFFIILFLSLFSLQSFSQNADLTILKEINKNEYPNWDKAMKVTSDGVYPFMGLSAGGVLIAGYVNKDDKMIRNGYKSLVAIAANLLFTEAFKQTVRRPRPFTTYPDDIIKRTKVSDFSFPSGHTSCAFATATALTLSTQKWYIAVPAYLYASFVAYSRMRLGVHFPTDILGGILVGIGTSLLTWQVDKWIQHK